MSIIHAVIAVSGPKDNLGFTGSGAEATNFEHPKARSDGPDPDRKLSISVDSGETKEGNEPNSTEHEPPARVGLSDELTGENNLTSFERRACGQC